MATDDHNEEFDNLEATTSFVDPAGIVHTGELADLSDTGQGGVALENTDGSTLLTADTLQARSNCEFIDDGDGTASLDVTDTDTHVTVENDDGIALLKNPDAIQAGANCDFIDDGDNTVTLDVSTGGSGGGETASDSATASGDGTTTTFAIGHSLGVTPEAATPIASSPDASADFYVSNMTSAKVEVTYASAPASGSSNLSWHLITHTSTAGSSTAASTDTKSGDGTTTVFGLPHDLSVAPTSATVRAASVDASTDFYVSNLTSTGVEITYAAAPPSGTSNLAWHIIAHE